MFDIERPQCLDDEQWRSVEDHLQRIGRAQAAGDLRLLVGSAKELCETVAKLVWTFTGQQFTSSTDMPDLTKRAQRAVDRVPGEGTATEGAARDIAQSARTLVLRLNEARNRAGTGHGSTAAAEIDEDDARLLVDAGVMWSRWVLARLDPVAEHSPVKLMSDLRSGSIFYKHDLARRLVETNLPTLDEADQRAVGLAVGQRGGIGQTSVVWVDGVRSTANSQDLTKWPPAYRLGVAEGVILDANGYAHPGSLALRAILAVLDALPDGGLDGIRHLTGLLRGARLAWPSLQAGASEASEVARSAADDAKEPLATALRDLADALGSLPT